MGYTTGGPLAIATAALAPERVQAIVLYASMARARGRRRRRLDLRRGGAPGDVGAARRGLGDGRQPRADRPLARRRPADEGVDGAHGAPVVEPGELVRAHGLHRRAATSARLLGELRVPTLILHRTGDRMIDVRHSRYLAERIPGARYVELEGVDNLPGAVDSSDMLGEIEEFLTGGRSRTVARELLTVIFSDIVGSTGHAARLGDARVARPARRPSDRGAPRDRPLRRARGQDDRRRLPDRLRRRAVARACAARRRSWARSAPSGLEVRVGLHTGECEVMGDDVGGMAVHIAARVAALAAPGRGAGLGDDVRDRRRGRPEVRGPRHAGAQGRARALAAVRAASRLTVCVHDRNLGGGVPCWGA